MAISLKPGLDASTDQAFAEARGCRGTQAVQPLVAFADEIAAVLETQFPDADPVAWRALMSAVQSAAAVREVLEPIGVQVTGEIVLNVLALAAERLDRQCGHGNGPRRVPEAAEAIALEVTRPRGQGGDAGGGLLRRIQVAAQLLRPARRNSVLPSSRS